MRDYGRKELRKEKVNLYIIIIMNLQEYLKRIKYIKEKDIYIMKMVIYIMDIQKME